ncbi:VUT family protein [Roseomonas sp. CCTCC AB2023176]|uniref:VUT family protein n=1 Tax=Roseomonas sp. CCTCC AB2023176 TaxID=3342640 RepID=UPI0035E2E8B9
MAGLVAGRRAGIAAWVALVGCAPAANWLIQHWGTVCIPNGPCLIPVGFGLMAPSGVLLIGLSFALRDIVHDRLGAAWSGAAILAGAAASLPFTPPALAFASGLSFVLSETADLAIYAALRERSPALAVLVSGLVGALADSVAFGWIAFGTVTWTAGLLLGKAYATLALAARRATRGRLRGRIAGP